jgi:uncharacterized Zn finger protein (UPF0148 family)
MGTINDLLRKMQGFRQEVESLSGKTIDIIPDDKGMIDRECPKENCQALFKVNAEDWKNFFKDEEVFCPVCRNNSPAKDYLPSSQAKAMKDVVHRAIMNNWHHNIPISHSLKAVISSEKFELDIQCEACNARFSIIGAAYFCPNCGHNSIERNAINAIDKLIYMAEHIDSIQKLLEDGHTKDDAAMITKRMIESAVSACIGTLQSFSENKYNQLSPTPAPFNAFQNVDKSDKLWLALKGQGYRQWLIATDISILALFIQRRHLLEHKGGIVDAKYLQATNDVDYKVGERLVILPTGIIALGRIVVKLISVIAKI